MRILQFLICSTRGNQQTGFAAAARHARLASDPTDPNRSIYVCRDKKEWDAINAECIKRSRPHRPLWCDVRWIDSETEEIEPFVQVTTIPPPEQPLPQTPPPPDQPDQPDQPPPELPRRRGRPRKVQ